MIKVFMIFALIGVVFMAYVRLAPHNLQAWHRVPEVKQDQDLVGGAVRVVPYTAELFTTLNQVAQSAPRSTRLAGAVDDGHVTYVVRSLVFGFPDYVTIWTDKETIVLYSRLRFGQSDLGVNKKRLEAWIHAAQNTSGS